MRKITLCVMSLMFAGTLLGHADVSMNTKSGDTGFLRNGRQWRMGDKQTLSDRLKGGTRFMKTATADEESSLLSGDNVGIVNTPDGTTWTYTLDKTMNEGSIAAVEVKVYDENNKLRGTISHTCELGENETRIADVRVNPLITKSFFNSSSSDHEVMLYVYANTPDYMGHSYVCVYSLESGNFVCTVEGNQVLAKNMAADSWGENYYMVFQRDAMMEVPSEAEEGETELRYMIYFDVYNKVGWGDNTPVLKHTFELNYDNISASGNLSLPILMQKDANNKLWFATAQYEKPYFEPTDSPFEEPVVTPDNNFLISLYDGEKFELKSTTTIPVPEVEGYLYTFPLVGGLLYTDDLDFEIFSDGTTPVYVVTFDHYQTASDSFVSSYYVYDTSGERLKTIFEYADDYIPMSDVAGQEVQYCFSKTEGSAYSFNMVDIPSCRLVVSIPSYLEDRALSAVFDRYIDGDDSYRYAISLAQGMEDASGNAIHTIAWINADGSLHHYDELNLGKGIQMVNPYIEARALDPYLFDTDEAREYMLLVKYGENESTTAIEERLYVVNTEGDILLNYGGKNAEGGPLATIYLLPDNPQPSILCVQGGYDTGYRYSLNFIDLPLGKFAAGGDGTAENPYLITTVGDFRQINAKPSAHYRLAADLDFELLSPYGGITSPFTGSFDGNGRMMAGLVLEGGGLFSQVQGSVKNFSLYRPVLRLGNVMDDAGFVADQLYGEGASVSDVHVYGPEVKAGGYSGAFGGIVGNLTVYGKVSACAVHDATFELPEATVGGIVGKTATSAMLTACSFNGLLKGDIAGGIVGEAGHADDKITHCHAKGDITGASTVGGIVGSSARSYIANCYAEGFLTLLADGNGLEYAAGGIAGSLEKAYETSGSEGAEKPNGNVIENCVVGISAMDIPGEVEDIYAHRIVGYSSADVKEIDWENTTDYENPVYLPSEPEKYIANNYVVSSLAVIDSEIVAEATTVEGATLAAADFNSEWLTARGFAAGTTVDAPWVHEKATPYLWFETYEASALMVDKTSVSLLVGEEATVTFTLYNGNIDLLDITSTNGIEIVSNETTEEQLVVKVRALAAGQHTLTATYGEKSVSCVFDIEGGNGLGDGLVTDRLQVLYDGFELKAEGAAISVYNLNGVLVMEGYDTVLTDRLADGIYIVAAHNDSHETATLKIAVNNNR